MVLNQQCCAIWHQPWHNNYGHPSKTWCETWCVWGKEIHVRHEPNYSLKGYRLWHFPLLKEVPLFAILTRNISSNFSPLVLVNMLVQFLKKAASYRPFKNIHFARVCKEKMMDHQYRENGARNHNQMRAYVECFSNQSKKIISYWSFHRSNRRNFEDSGKVLAVSVSEIYQSTAVRLYQPTLIRWLSPLYVYK